jgi:putative peptidoglycan lipid II flippase
VFPLFSRYAARGDTVNLRNSINRALRLSIFEGLPSGVGLLLMATPLATLLFAGRNFAAADADQTAHVVRFYGIGMWAFCAQQILYRAFYAQKVTTTPMKVACSIVGVNFALNLVLIWVPSIRHGAFGLSTSITATLNVLILAYILRGRLGRIGARALAKSVARIALASAAMGASVWASLQYLPQWHTPKNMHVVLGAVAAGMATYLLATWLLRAPELGELLGRRKNAGDEADQTGP